MELTLYMEERRRRVDAFLESHFREGEARLSNLRKAVRYSLLAGGKRIRPILTIAAFEACSSASYSMGGVGGRAGSPPDFSEATGFAGAERIAVALRVGSGVEMIHTYSLIHDDLPAMDNDDLRRGRPTNHKVFGEAMAILAGDALLTEAFLVIAQSEGVPPAALVDIIGDIAAAAGGTGMAGGQALDLESEGRKISPEELEFLHRQKTGRLIEVSVTSGAKLAGADGRHLMVMRHYGEAVGLAFQIADDILDVEGGVQEMGKSTGADAKKLKATYPSILGLERSKKLAEEYAGKAVEALSEFDRKADPLREIARYIVSRKS